MNTISYPYRAEGIFPKNADELEKLKSEAKQGDANAQNMLAFILHGERCYKDAYEWFQKAAKQGHIYAQFNLENLHKELHGKL